MKNQQSKLMSVQQIIEAITNNESWKLLRLFVEERSLRIWNSVISIVGYPKSLMIGGAFSKR